MTVHLLASVKGSPGVTSTALALATSWPKATGRRVLVVDADPSGSGILPGYLRAAIPADQGLLQLAAARPRDLASALFDATVPLDPDSEVLLLPGLTDPSQAATLTGLWADLAALAVDLTADGMDVIVDAGRVAADSALEPLLDAANGRILVTRSSLASLATVSPFLNRASRTGSWRVLVIGPGRPYSTSEVSAALEAAEPLLELPWDPVAARTFSDGAAPGWRHPRSSLLRGARVLAQRLSHPANSRGMSTPVPAAEPIPPTSPVAAAVTR